MLEIIWISWDRMPPRCVFLGAQLKHVRSTMVLKLISWYSPTYSEQQSITIVFSVSEEIFKQKVLKSKMFKRFSRRIGKMIRINIPGLNDSNTSDWWASRHSWIPVSLLLALHLNRLNLDEEKRAHWGRSSALMASQKKSRETCEDEHLLTVWQWSLQSLDLLFLKDEFKWLNLNLQPSAWRHPS